MIWGRSRARALVPGAGFKPRGGSDPQYKPEDLPPALTSYVQERGGYDY